MKNYISPVTQSRVVVGMVADPMYRVKAGGDMFTCNQTDGSKKLAEIRLSKTTSWTAEFDLKKWLNQWVWPSTTPSWTANFEGQKSSEILQQNFGAFYTKN